jgi:hypothetical protein
MNDWVLSSLPLVLQSSSSSGGGGSLILLVAGPVVGTAIYGAVYRFYRNADKSDQFERETRIELKDAITGQEQKVDEVKGTRDRRIDGDNSRSYRARVAELD